MSICRPPIWIIAQTSVVAQPFARETICKKAQQEETVLIVKRPNHESHDDDDDENDTDWAIDAVAILKACAKQKDLQRGSRLHTDIVNRGLLRKNFFIGSALVSMYAKCGVLEKAQEVFDELSLPNVVVWNALIAGYTQEKASTKALTYFKQMQLEGCLPNAVTLSCCLKACGRLEALGKGQEIHAQVVRESLLEEEVVLANNLLDMYVKCGAVEKAQEILNELPAQNIVLWTTLIAGYVQHGLYEEALICFKQMHLTGFSPNPSTFACILKACGTTRALGKGQEIHAHIVRRCWQEQDTVVTNALVDMYAKCGALDKAYQIFHTLKIPNIISWTALIGGYAQHGYGAKALAQSERMQLESFSPDAVTFTCLLKACAGDGALDKGQEIHSYIVKDQQLNQDRIIASALIDLYAKCDVLHRAQKVFDELSAKDIVLWNALISGYSQQGHCHEALNLFAQIQRGTVSPNSVTFACILEACGSIRALDKALEVHAQAFRCDFMQKEIIVANTLIDTYAQCSTLEKAQEVFDALPLRNSVSWNALITGYALNGHSEQALDHFEKMQLGGFSPNAVTYTTILKACGDAGALAKGQEVHARIVEEHLLEGDILIANVLVDMYSKCGSVEKAQEVLDEIPIRDEVSWNVLIAGCAQSGLDEATLRCYKCMQEDGFSPDLVTYTYILKACGSIGALHKGQEIHAEVERLGLLEECVIICTALLVMYANCGHATLAHQLFNQLRVRDVISWSALMEGYALLGKHEIVLNLFSNMIEDNIEPSLVSFTIVLNVCKWKGLWHKAQMYLEMMSKDYNLIPTIEHRRCMIDIFCHSGHLEKAASVFEEVPSNTNVDLWHTLLEACWKEGNTKLGSLAFEHVVCEAV